MDNQERLLKLKETFNDAASGYDNPALRFFKTAAQHLAGRMKFRGSERVLDVACGTGAVALECARRLDAGSVTGVDMSEGMLRRAKEKALEQGLGNVDFLCSDLHAMDFAPASFDAASCGFGIFFLPDMEAGLRAIAQHVKPGGAIGISSFTGAMMEPLSQKFVERIQAYGVEVPPLSWKRLDDADKHAAVYRAAGLENVSTRTGQVGYDLAGFDEWWDILWHSGFRGLLNQLSASDLARFRREHGEEIEMLAREHGLWLNVEVLISVGYKPLEQA
jgi:ubiquinone/menaquinone biosynthesis C-methylase UbiE